jgi:exonuclease III
MRLLSYNVHGLPWSKDQSASIVRYVSHIRPDVLCFQEVFTDKLRSYFSSELKAHGYTVVSPRDGGVTVLGSGLLIAFSTKYTLLGDCFYPYTIYHDIEIGVNKGFQTVRLLSNEGRRYIVANTHLQSTTAFNILDRSSTVPAVLKAQMAEIVRWLEPLKDPVILAGDMNCEYSPHPHVRFLHHGSSVKKSTFPLTGEDLDHVAWIPTQWAPPGVSWCRFDTKGIRAATYSVDPVDYSDHFPILVDLVIPEIHPTKKECVP